jgi:hypothetical protein
MNLFARGQGGGMIGNYCLPEDPTVLSPSRYSNREKGRGALCENTGSFLSVVS